MSSLELSIFLAKVIGLYLLIKPLVVIVNYRKIKNLGDDFLRNDGLRLTVGLLVIIFGLILVVSHNVWVANWRVIITLYAWLILLKGLFGVFLVVPLEKCLRLLDNKAYVITTTIVVFVLGAYLTYVGFCGGL